VFDDNYSIVHLIAGAVTPLFPPILAIFLIYELVETMRKERERKEHFVGDILEYLTGVAAFQLTVLLLGL